MTDMTAVLGLVGALGAAAIGAIGGSLLQRSRSRQEATAASLQRANAERERVRLAEEAERERVRLTEQLALETIASARTVNRALLSLLERSLQDAEAGRPVELSAFDDEAGTLELELLGALHRLVTIAVALPPGPSMDNQGLFTDRFTERHRAVRKYLLDAAAGGSTEPLAEAIQMASVTSAALDQYLRAAISLFIDRPEGSTLALYDV